MLTSQVRFSALAVATVLTAFGVAGAARDVRARDEQVVVARDVPATEALSAVNGITVVGEARKQRIALFCNRFSPEDLLTSFTRNFGWRTRKGITGTELFAATSLKSEAEIRRNSQVRAGRDLLRRRILLAGQAIAGDGAARQKLEKLSPYTLLFVDQMQGRQKVLSAFGPEIAATLPESGWWASSPIDQAPEALRADLRKWAGDGVGIALLPGQTEPTQQQIASAREALNRRIADQRLVLQLFGEPENPGIRGDLIDANLMVPGRPQRDVTGLVLMYPHELDHTHLGPRPPLFLDEPNERDRHPLLQRRISLESKSPQMAPVRYVDVLERIASASGFNILSDSYQSTRGDYLDWRIPLKEVPLWRVIRQIEYDFNYDCVVQEPQNGNPGWLLWRHHRWPREYFREWSTTTLRETDEKIARQRGLHLTDLTDLVRSLKQDQFKNIPALYPEIWNARLPYRTLRLLATLKLQQRRFLTSERGLVLADLDLQQRRLALEIVQAARPYVSSLDAASVVITAQGLAGEPRFTLGRRDTFGPSMRSFYPIQGIQPESLPPQRRAPWEEIDY